MSTPPIDRPIDPSLDRSSSASVSAEAVREFMEVNWREPGFTCPNADTYPWLWLWDSCFHSLIWAALGEEQRAISELRAALAHQHPSGFVPHVVYYDGYKGHNEFWRAQGTSTITQPPIYGHTIAVLGRAGLDIPQDLIERARLGFEFLLRRRHRTTSGLVEMLHPWESGCDHSPRWDDLFCGAVQPGGSDSFDTELWYRRKGEMVASIVLDDGAPTTSADCRIGSVAFNALIAFCAEELATFTEDHVLADAAAELSRSLSNRWNGELRTWVDDDTNGDGSRSVRTLEALLPILVERRSDVVESVSGQLLDPAAFGGRCGLRQVHPVEPTFDPAGYWRGASWPQLNYLFEFALRSKGMVEEAEIVGRSARRGAMRSRFSEYWHPDTGDGHGAKPQSWAGLALLNQHGRA